MKKKLSFLLVFVMILSAMSFAFADMPETEECCGEEHVHELAALGNGDGGIVPMYSGNCPDCNSTRGYTYTVKNSDVHRVHCKDCSAYVLDEEHSFSGPACTQTCTLCTYSYHPVAHNYSSSWTYYSASQHRRTCRFVGCSAYLSDPHAWSSWTVTTNTLNGTHTGTRTCSETVDGTVCGYRETSTRACRTPTACSDAYLCFLGY